LASGTAGLPEVCRLGIGGYKVTCPLRLFAAWWAFPIQQALYLKGLSLRLRGKSFRWRRRGGVMVLRVGYAHAAALAVGPAVRLGFANKNFIHVWGTSEALLSSFAHTLQGLKEPNIYHGRGIRLAKQPLCRKFGKVSAYR